jgi:hypothetical protein
MTIEVPQFHSHPTQPDRLQYMLCEDNLSVQAYFNSKRWYLYTRLHGATPRKGTVFIFKA